MELQTISQVSKYFSISTRTLRYYEQIGLITPVKKEGFAYRAYDMETITRLHQIIILRKLRIPLKQIARILQSTDVRVAIEAFEHNLMEIEDEITALSTIRSIIKAFIEHLNLGSAIFALPDDEGLLEIVDSLTVSKINFKEEKSMEQLNHASEKLSKLEDKDVRIVYLPPMTVAAAYASGEGCEGKAMDMINQFIKDSGLLKIKPDARSFGFDCSKEAIAIGEPSHVYEGWVSVPNDIEIPMPLVKRTFNGGLYAAHVLRTWDFEDWRLLREWVNASDKYDNDWGSPRWTSPETSAGQGFEETLNFYNFAQKGGKMENLQLDLLFPIKEKDNGKL
ncbi:effector binding domain-containing protein [Tissierella sp. MB52-C2]|uniref:MerR family transcriptional regulator n=1 Tax=Tissierella sp. MB52-C2 TaxID=3070999 RepID=UPI00280C24C7|nr:MerR family transcriptional regulator [Tissierella sp. MB52-C2]WMM25308.1 effector binding domain-containing protein [Tissierella sp. MB52-C2]